jgi:hypothetical protein
MSKRNGGWSHRVPSDFMRKLRGRSVHHRAALSHPEAPIRLQAGQLFAAAIWPVQKMTLRLSQ